MQLTNTKSVRGLERGHSTFMIASSARNSSFIYEA